MKAFFKLLFLNLLLLGAFPMQAQIGLSIQMALDQIVSTTKAPVLALAKTPTPAPLPNPPLSMIQQSIPSSYSYDHLGVFCKLEVQLEKKFKLPMKFRLGEVHYTEQLEYGPR